MNQYGVGQMKFFMNSTKFELCHASAGKRSKIIIAKKSEGYIRRPRFMYHVPNFGNLLCALMERPYPESIKKSAFPTAPPVASHG
jgi:hypothetical protein